jgi:hypothetical protein
MLDGMPDPTHPESRTQLLAAIEQLLVTADRLGARDVGIHLDRARVALSPRAIERRLIFAD